MYHACASLLYVTKDKNPVCLWHSCMWNFESWILDLHLHCAALRRRGALRIALERRRASGANHRFQEAVLHAAVWLLGGNAALLNLIVAHSQMQRLPTFPCSFPIPGRAPCLAKAPGRVISTPIYPTPAPLHQGGDMALDMACSHMSHASSSLLPKQQRATPLR